MLRLFHTIDRINEWVGKFVSLWIAAMTGIVVYEVIMRYIFNKPTIWVHELSLYIFGVMWILAGGYTLYGKRMVNMDVFYGRFSAKGQAIFDLCTFIFAIIFCVVLLWKSGADGWLSLKHLDTSGTAWDVPFYPVRLALPAGALLLLIQVLSKFIKDLYLITGRNTVER